MSETEIRSVLASLYRTLGNVERLHTLTLLEAKPMTFGVLMKELQVNPQVLNRSLNQLRACGLVAKSYPYKTYVLTPLGHSVVKKLVKDAMPLAWGLKKGETQWQGLL
ncbi:MAG: ArsR family transcriptional regulator [Candidatus Bathyarchaeia archaeon]